MTTEHILALLGIAPASSETDVLRLLIELGVQSCDGDEGSLLVFDREQNDLVFAMTTDAESESALVGQRVPLGVGLTGLAAQTQLVQSGSPVFKDIEQAETRRGTDGEPDALIAAPMLLDDELIGVMTVVSFDSAKRFGPRELGIFSRAATVAAVVVEQRRALDALAVLQRGDALPPPRTEQEQNERKLGALVGELAANNRARSDSLLALLEHLAALTR